MRIVPCEVGILTFTIKWLPIPDLSPEDDARLRQLVEAFLAERQGRAPKRLTLAWWGGAQALREHYI